MPNPLFDQAALDRQSRQLPSSLSVDSVGNLAGPALSTSSPSPQRGSLLGPAAMTIAGNAADIGSTLWALKKPGIYEANPVFGGNTAAMVGLKSALTIPEIYVEHQLNQSGHPTAAKILGAVIGGLGGALAMHNINTAKGK